MPRVSHVVIAFMAGTFLMINGCSPAQQTSTSTVQPTERSDAFFERDRESILAMAGNYRVRFDFIETVPFEPDYRLKEPKVSGGYEMVRVLEDTGDFISLQHTLVVGPQDSPFVIKHWRQDWQYEPDRVLMFIGGNAWQWDPVSKQDGQGAWSQTVYQVDDGPRYGAVGHWTYENDLAEWTPPREWRPLPRRDMTTRDDYHAVNAVNRHVITPWGWVHEQDNTKLALSSGTPTPLVRETGVNTYQRYDDFPYAKGEAYWAATDEYWRAIRTEWAEIADQSDAFAITVKGETEAVYMPLLQLADSIQSGEITTADAITQAQDVIKTHVSSDIGELQSRLRLTSTKDDVY
ncbi:MAG: DUF6607 family protein [Pseudomonadota bacterium]